MQVGGVSVEDLIALGVVVIILQRGEIRIVNIRQPSAAYAAILILVTVFRFALGTKLKATQGVQLKTHLLDATTACVNIFTQSTENLRIFFRILVVFFPISANFNNPFFLVQDLSPKIVYLGIILHLSGNAFTSICNLV